MIEIAERTGILFAIGLGMKTINPFFLFFFLAPSVHAAMPWSTEAHNDLIETAFSQDRADCVQSMEAGSLWVDSLPNQLPSKSYMHAMRSSQQSIDDAKKLMADYIQSEYEIASQLLSTSTEVVNGTPDDPLAQFTPDQRLITNMSDYLSYCEHRGHAQHTVMDSTSPAHAGFAIWSPTDIPEIFHHGDLPGSIENLQALLENPDLKQETIGLMQIVQKLYIDLNMKDFRFE